MKMHDSLSQGAGEQKCSVPTSTNVAYGCEHAELVMSDMPSGATMVATQGPIYETISI